MLFPFPYSWVCLGVLGCNLFTCVFILVNIDLNNKKHVTDKVHSHCKPGQGTSIDFLSFKTASFLQKSKNCCFALQFRSLTGFSFPSTDLWTYEPMHLSMKPQQFLKLECLVALCHALFHPQLTEEEVLGLKIIGVKIVFEQT